MQRVRQRIAAVFGAFTRETTMAEMRAAYDAMFDPDGASAAEPVAIGTIAGEWVRAGDEPNANAILYFHGGGYQIGSTRSHRDLMARLGRAAEADVLGFDYRRAPENRFPAAIDDALSVWRGILDAGRPAASVAFAGDSAGAGLAVATMLAARDAGLPLPGAGALMSPWLDLEASGESYVSRAELDPLSQRPVLLAMARAYLGREGNPRDPRASPIHADPSGLPPMVIHVGDHELVLDDSRRFARMIEAAGGEVELVVWDRMIHQFQMFPELPEASQSIEAMGRFLRGKIQIEVRPDGRAEDDQDL